MLLVEKRVEIEKAQVDMSKGEQLNPEFLAINPRGTLSVLVTETSIALTENIACAAYIEEKYPDPPLMGEGAEEKASVLMWNSICEH